MHLDALRKQFPQLEQFSTEEFLGIVAPCYLGDPFEVHTLTVTGEIIQHYKKGCSLPSQLECARRLAASEKYVCIEVYKTCLCAISEDGSVAMIARNNGK